MPCWSALARRANDLERKTVFVRKIFRALPPLLNDLASATVAVVVRLDERDSAVVINVYLSEGQRAGAAECPEPAATRNDCRHHEHKERYPRPSDDAPRFEAHRFALQRRRSGAAHAERSEACDVALQRLVRPGHDQKTISVCFPKYARKTVLLISSGKH